MPPGETKTGDLFSPEGILIFSLAILLDIVGVICLILDLLFGVGEILSWISDLFGIIFISSWMFMRTRVVLLPERAKGGLRRLFGGRWSKILIPIIGEVTPVIGVFPFWSLSVFFELTS